ncbi:DUF2381 family protein [Hyalangium gracile]|uniref:DUF2381 family protein n=1 Tax=Hyalangium gracile TaxID=394092 RepID=UPI001CCAD8A5|nr:DUF2381 family protein [Hyalangium gracile]
MTRPITWLLLVPLLAASTAAAQPQPARQRQDRRASLPSTPADSLPEVYVAAGNSTVVAFNGPLDKNSLMVDRTRFRWVDVGDNTLVLEPIADLSPGERLILQVGFKDKALPAKAVLAVLSKADVVDAKVEVDRRAHTPEALIAALTQKEAELEELKARSTELGPASLVFSGWLTEGVQKRDLHVGTPSPSSMGLIPKHGSVYRGTLSTLVVISLWNLPGQPPWTPGQARITGLPGAPVKVISVRMKPEQLAPGEHGSLVVEAVLPPLEKTSFAVEVLDASGQQRISLNLEAK